MSFCLSFFPSLYDAHKDGDRGWPAGRFRVYRLRDSGTRTHAQYVIHPVHSAPAFPQDHPHSISLLCLSIEGLFTHRIVFPLVGGCTGYCPSARLCSGMLLQLHNGRPIRFSPRVCVCCKHCVHGTESGVLCAGATVTLPDWPLLSAASQDDK